MRQDAPLSRRYQHYEAGVPLGWGDQEGLQLRPLPRIVHDDQDPLTLEHPHQSSPGGKRIRQGRLDPAEQLCQVVNPVSDFRAPNILTHRDPDDPAAEMVTDIPVMRDQSRQRRLSETTTARGAR